MKRTGLLAVVFGLGCLTLFWVGCKGQKTDTPNNPLATPETAVVSNQPVEWKSDGIISDNEYTNEQMVGDIDVFTRVNGDTVMMAFKVRTNGYAALGIGAEDKMKGADIIMCSVTNGKVSLTEMFSTGRYGPHPPKQGGAASVQMVSGSYQDGLMVVEFMRKLNPGGPQDKPLVIGENKVIWSIGDNDNIELQQHSRRGYGTLTLQ